MKKITTIIFLIMLSILGYASSVDTNTEDEAIQKPRLVFANEGIFLPSQNEQKIFIRSFNVEKAKIHITKIYDNNITQYLHMNTLKGNGDSRKYWEEDRIDQVGDEVYSGDISLEYDKNKWTQTALDISKITKDKGVYLIEINVEKEGTPYDFGGDMDSWEINDYFRNNLQVSKTVVFTDMAILGHITREGYIITVMDIPTNSSKSGVTLKLMSRSGQILEQKKTGKNGNARFALHKNDMYILAEKDNDRSILVLNNTVSTDGMAVGGATPAEGIVAYLYTERGVYRPGDTVYLSAIVRNNGEKTPDGQPILVTIYDPQGAKYKDKEVVKESKNGFYTYEFKTYNYDKTGVWRIVVEIGDATFYKDISVETVVAQKVQVTTNLPKEIDFTDKNYASWDIEAKYLIGAPASGLAYEVTYDAVPHKPKFEKFEKYTFEVPGAFTPAMKKDTTGVLNNEGKANVDLFLTTEGFGSTNMTLTTTVSVTEDSGRPAKTTAYSIIKKYDSYLGIEQRDRYEYKSAGEPIDVRTIVVSSDGENYVAGEEIEYAIYENKHSWWYDYNNYNSYISSLKSDKYSELVKEGTFTSKEEPFTINYVPKEDCTLYIEVTNKKTGQRAATIVEVGESWEKDVTRKVEILNIKSDKKEYVAGDTATVTFPGIVGAKAMIAIESQGKIINRKLIDIKSTTVKENIKLTKDMAPNIYYHVSLIQDYKNITNDRGMRLYGSLPLTVVNLDTKLDIKINAPDSARPNQDFDIEVHNSTNTKMDYTIAVVDEGLLALTSFGTPNPWRYFYRKLASGVSLVDNYTEIIGMPRGKTHSILKVGGDEEGMLMSMDMEKDVNERKKDLGIENEDRFKPVVIFKGVLTTDEKGYGKINVNIPSYMGAVRIMVVGATDKAYGSAEKTTVIKEPAVVLADLPRKLKIGDEFMVPVTIIATEPDIGPIQVKYTSKGVTQTQNVELANGEKKILYFTDTAGTKVGTETIAIQSISRNYTYEEKISIAVDTSGIATSENYNDTLLKGGEKTYKKQTNYIEGTVDGYLTLSTSPLIGLEDRFNYLIEYPYGCLEQTTSKGLAQLYLEKLLPTLSVEAKEKIRKNVNYAIAKIERHKTKIGGFAYWEGDYTPSQWASTYAGQFLLLAKDMGYHVPADLLTFWENYIAENVRTIDNNSRIDRDWKAYALYLLAVANKADISQMNSLYESNFDDLSLTAKMYLATAYSIVGNQKIAKKIAKEISYDKIRGQFVSKDNYASAYYNYSYGSELREMAVYLLCYNKIYGKGVSSAYDHVLTALKSKTWYSTQSVAYALYSLADTIQGSPTGDIKATVTIDGKTQNIVANGAYRGKLPEGVKTITVKSNTESKLFVNQYWNGVPVNDNVPEYSEGFALDTKFYDKYGNVIDPTKLASGDTIWMEVIVKPQQNAAYIDNIALVQALPSGWEIDNTRLEKTAAAVANSTSNITSTTSSDEEDTSWEAYLASNLKYSNGTKYSTSLFTAPENGDRALYIDIRDDRIIWHFNHGYKPEYHFFVKINAVTRGIFTLPGTKLEAMYDNNYRAYKKGFKVEVK